MEPLSVVVGELDQPRRTEACSRRVRGLMAVRRRGDWKSAPAIQRSSASLPLWAEKTTRVPSGDTEAVSKMRPKRPVGGKQRRDFARRRVHPQVQGLLRLLVAAEDHDRLAVGDQASLPEAVWRTSMTFRPRSGVSAATNASWARYDDVEVSVVVQIAQSDASAERTGALSRRARLGEARIQQAVGRVGEHRGPVFRAARSGSAPEETSASAYALARGRPANT